jgi:putative ribosome biogenesis GTPase RsgA
VWRSGELSELRYLNYLTLLEEAEEQNYWERRKV